MAPNGTLKTCDKGHQFYKSSDCPTSPVCEEERKPKNNFLAFIGAPARRALERENFNTLEDLAKCTEKEIIKLHGIGPSTIPKFKKALNDNGLSFKTK
jgi:predicted RecB family nuclease